MSRITPPRKTPWALLALFLLGQAACNTDKTVSQTEKAATPQPIVSNSSSEKNVSNPALKQTVSQTAAAATQKDSKERVDSENETKKQKAFPTGSITSDSSNTRTKNASKKRRKLENKRAEAVVLPEASQLDNIFALMEAIGKGYSLQAIKLLIQKASQKYLNATPEYLSKELSILGFAIYRGASKEVIEMLLEAEPNLEVTQKYYNYKLSVLGLAIQKEAPPKVIKMLLEAKPNLEATQKYSDRELSVLGFAIHERAPLEVIKMLLEAKPNLEATQKYNGNAYECSVLGFASSTGAPLEVIEMLLEAKPNLEATQKYYNYKLSVLGGAIYRKASLEVIKMLLDYGADVKAKQKLPTTRNKYKKITVKQLPGYLKKRVGKTSPYYAYYDEIEKFLKNAKTKKK